MGDRCWLGMEFRASDKDELVNALSENTGWDSDIFDEDEDDNGVVSASVDDINYGWWDELDKLAKTGIPFKGNHGAGSDYGPASFVSHNKNVLYATESRDGDIVVPIDAEGNVSDVDRAVVIEFYRAVKFVDEKFEAVQAATLLANTG